MRSILPDPSGDGQGTVLGDPTPDRQDDQLAPTSRLVGSDDAAPDPFDPTRLRLSQDFAAAGRRATTLLRAWQGRIADTIRLHLPLCEPCIAADRDQAAEAVRLAALLASNDADRAALSQLLDLFENFQRWSDALVEDNKTGGLGRYYMSPTGLNDDPMFQKTADCARFLAPMLASRHLAEDASCQ